MDEERGIQMNKEALFQEAYESGKDAIYRICCCYVRDPEDRNDAYQEVLLRLYRYIGSYQGRAALKTWIYRIAVNTCLDFLRARKRREKMLNPVHETDLENVDDPSRHGSRTDNAIDVERMYDCIRQLPVLDCTLASLYLEDASSREMAEVLGISESNVRVKLSRIRETLRQMLEVRKYGTR
jgi:RNA polymerase sigma-70 factor, ECF subfamily